MVADADKDLLVVLAYLAGRQLSQKQVQEALGVSRSTYNEQAATGGLIRADRLIHAARALDINPVEILVRYGIIDAKDALKYVRDHQRHAADAAVYAQDTGPRYVVMEPKAASAPANSEPSAPSNSVGFSDIAIQPSKPPL